MYSYVENCFLVLEKVVINEKISQLTTKVEEIKVAFTISHYFSLSS